MCIRDRNWLEADQENLKGVVKELPTREEIDVPVNLSLIHICGSVSVLLRRVLEMVFPSS